MATTTNFGWETPDDTDLVKDGALAIRTLGSAIDTSLVDLKGGTTGQVLSKTSNTDMDFTWVTSDDANAIQNAIVDAKGDLITATAADTPARLAVGANGTVLTADSAEATGLKWAAPSGGSTFAGCSLYLGSAISTSNDTYTTMTFNSENFDSDGYHSTSTNTSRITIPAGKGGKYLFYGNIGFTGNANGVRTATILKNGTTYLFFNTKEPGATYEGSAEITQIVNAVATDYFELLVRQDSGGSLNTSSGTDLTVFSCAYLGA